MAKMASMELRTRQVAAVDAGSSCRAAAVRFATNCAIKVLAFGRQAGAAAPGRGGR